MLNKTLLISLLFTSNIFAHSAVMSCFDNSDETITCEGGFSDGATGRGAAVYVKQKGKILLKDKMNIDSEFTFNKPKGEYLVVFDAGKSHIVEIHSKYITE